MSQKEFKKATIKDLQLETGLSLGCISKFLNGGNVTDENRTKIQMAILKTGYQVNVNARGLKSGNTKSIGIIIPEFGNTFYGLLASKMAKILSEKGYDTFVNEHYSSPEQEKKAISILQSRRVDAIITVPSFDDAHLYDNIKSCPFIFFDNYTKGMPGDSIVVNNREIAEKAMDLLFENGHKEIAVILGDQMYTAFERKQGVIDSFKKHNLNYEGHIFLFDNSIEGAYKSIKQILSSNKFTAVFAANYIATLGTIFFLNEFSLHIPEDFSIIGFDNIMITNLFRPKLTIVNQPLDKIAEVTVQRVLERIFDRKDKYSVDVLECEMELGSTVKNIKNS